jgi:hypothetical protein
MPTNRFRTTQKLPFLLGYLAFFMLCPLLGVGLVSCGSAEADEAGGRDSQKRGRGGLNIAQDLPEGSELGYEYTLEGTLGLKSADLGLLFTLAEIDGFDILIKAQEVVRCLEHDGQRPVQLELIQTSSRVELPELLNNLKNPLLNQPVLLTLEGKNNWNAQKKGTRLVSSEEQEELALIAAMWRLDSRLWPEKRLGIDEEWESGSVRVRDVATFGDVTASSTVKLVSVANKGGRDYAQLERFTTYNTVMASMANGFVDGIKFEGQFETKLLFDVEKRYVAKEVGKGLLKCEITLSDEDGETFVVVLEGPVNIEYKAAMNTTANASQLIED